MPSPATNILFGTDLDPLPDHLFETCRKNDFGVDFYSGETLSRKRIVMIQSKNGNTECYDPQVLFSCLITQFVASYPRLLTNNLQIELQPLMIRSLIEHYPDLKAIPSQPNDLPAPLDDVDLSGPIALIKQKKMTEPISLINEKKTARPIPPVNEKSMSGSSRRRLFVKGLIGGTAAAIATQQLLYGAMALLSKYVDDPVLY